MYIEYIESVYGELRLAETSSKCVRTKIVWEEVANDTDWLAGTAWWDRNEFHPTLCNCSGGQSRAHRYNTLPYSLLVRSALDAERSRISPQFACRCGEFPHVACVFLRRLTGSYHQQILSVYVHGKLERCAHPLCSRAVHKTNACR